MSYQSHGEVRPTLYWYSRVLILVLLVSAATFSQQKEEAPLKLETASTTNERIMRLAAATNTKQSDYVVGSGDSLGIEVFDVPELSREVRVSETGYISVPLIPTRIRAEGLTTFQLQEKLTELLQINGLVSNPQVTVFIKEQRSQPITVIGAVKTATVIQAGRQTNLLEVLSRAGGISDDAGSVVMVTRSPSVAAPVAGSAESKTNSDALPPLPQTFTIDLNDLLDRGDSRFNIPVVGGDVVSVPRAGIVYVVGAVTRPGGFVMQNDRDRMTALKVLSLAGGTIGTAKGNRAVILRKNADTGVRQEVPVDLDRVLHLKGEDVTLQASDILFVPDSTAKKVLRRTGDLVISLTTGLALLRASRF